MSVAAVVIGRNEGARLIACLTSLRGLAQPIIYVDSGSADGSVAAARDLGADVVALDLTRPFTAARARNAGLARLAEMSADWDYVQFVDGDCTLAPDWIAKAKAALDADPGLAVVCGRRREKHPEASLWNRMIDAEWDTPVGAARACGGDALMRRTALDAVGGYRDDMIAGEEPEMCFRMREMGWHIRRIDAEMTAHDAALTRMGQWWQRCRRAGHAYAEGAALHGRKAPEHYNMREVSRALAWGIGVPLAALAGAWSITPWALALFLAWPLQVVRLRRRGMRWSDAFFLVLGKLAEAQGILTYGWRRATGQSRRLIEYK